jgi:hypothetical protein
MPKAVRDALDDKSTKWVATNTESETSALNIAYRGQNLGKDSKPLQDSIGYRGRASNKFGMDTNDLANPNNLDLYFLEQDLKKGKTLTLDFSTDPSTRSAKFLPRQEAEKIPFSADKLPEILERFSVKPGSVEAQTIENTLKSVGTEGKVDFVATSLESMIDYATSKMDVEVKKGGVDVEIESSSTETEIEIQVGSKKNGVEVEVEVHPNKIEVEIEIGGAELEIEIPLKNKLFTITSGPWKVVTNKSKALVCHKQKYPHAVFCCRGLRKTRAYMVPLKGANGIQVKALALCDLDTSDWNPNNVAFKMLKIERGTVPVCRFLSQDYIVWSRKN